MSRFCMFRFCLATVLTLIALSCTSQGQEAKLRQNVEKAKAEKGFVTIFDGKTWHGWSGNLDHFRIADNAIVGGSLQDRVPRNEFLTYKDEFGNFELRLQAKLIGKGGNAGIQIRSRRMPKDHAKPYEMIGYQVDMGKAWDKVWWGKLYDESRRAKVLAGPDDTELLEKLVKWDDWNDYRIRCRGNRVQVWLNGKQTVDYRETDADIEATGLIGLQIHGGPPSEAWYKNVRIKQLKKKPKTKAGSDS